MERGRDRECSPSAHMPPSTRRRTRRSMPAPCARRTRWHPSPAREGRSRGAHNPCMAGIRPSHRISCRLHRFCERCSGSRRLLLEWRGRAQNPADVSLDVPLVPVEQLERFVCGQIVDAAQRGLPREPSPHVHARRPEGAPANSITIQSLWPRSRMPPAAIAASGIFYQVSPK